MNNNLSGSGSGYTDDFKYIIQDMGAIYIGKELTYFEMMERKDVPFKFQAIINTYISKDVDLNVKMSQHILDITKDAFSYRVYEQLKVSVRIYFKIQKKGFGGKIKEKWEHKTCSFNDFCDKYRDGVIAGNIEIEDVSISKLALMAFSV